MTINSIAQLKKEISVARILLNKAWDIYGETNQHVVEVGEYFDRLLNEYYQLTNKFDHQ